MRSLENSLRAIALTGRPGHIIISALENVEAVQIEIEDNGAGFKNVERVFEPFYTTEAEHKGLGLTFVYQIVQLHNGQVRAESGATGGARIVIRLPKIAL